MLLAIEDFISYYSIWTVRYNNNNIILFNDYDYHTANKENYLLPYGPLIWTVYIPIHDSNV